MIEITSGFRVGRNLTHSCPPLLTLVLFFEPLFSAGMPGQPLCSEYQDQILGNKPKVKGGGQACAEARSKEGSVRQARDFLLAGLSEGFLMTRDDANVVDLPCEPSDPLLASTPKSG